MALIIRSVKTCVLGPPRPFVRDNQTSEDMKPHIITTASSFLQCPRRSRSSFSLSCCLNSNALDSGECL